MILYLLIWFGSSIIISLLLARIIGRGGMVIHDEEDAFVYGDWLVKNTMGQQTYLDKSEDPSLTTLNSDWHLGNSNKTKVSLN